MGTQHATGPEPRAVGHDEHLTARLWRRAGSGDPIACRHTGEAWQTVTWAELADRVEAVAAGLVALGVERGDRVAIMSDTRLEWTIADLAILAVGGVTVPIYATDSVDQCAHILTDSGATVAFAAGSDHAKRLEDARGEAPGPGAVLVFDDGALDALSDRAGRDERSEVRRRAESLTVDDLASIVYTSGTTGAPKGCALTHGNLVWTARQAETALAPLFEGDASTLLFLPLAHIFTRLIQFGCLDQDVTLAYARSMDTLADDIRSFRPTFLLAVPRVFQKVHDRAQAEASGAKRKVFDFAESTAHDWSRADDPGLRVRARHAVADKLVYSQLRDSLGGRVRYGVSGGAPLNPELAHFFDAAGITILQGYGLTETSSAVTVDTPDGPRIGTSGPPLPGVEVAIDDGEVLVRGPNVFRGYWNNRRRRGIRSPTTAGTAPATSGTSTTTAT